MKPYDTINKTMPHPKFLTFVKGGEENPIKDVLCTMYFSETSNGILYEECGDKAIIITLHLDVTETHVIVNMNYYTVKLRREYNIFDRLMSGWEVL